MVFPMDLPVWQPSGCILIQAISSIASMRRGSFWPSPESPDFGWEKTMKKQQDWWFMVVYGCLWLFMVVYGVTNMSTWMWMAKICRGWFWMVIPASYRLIFSIAKRYSAKRRRSRTPSQRRKTKRYEISLVHGTDWEKCHHHCTSNRIDKNQAFELWREAYFEQWEALPGEASISQWNITKETKPPPPQPMLRQGVTCRSITSLVQNGGC